MTRRDTPEHLNPQQNRCESLKCLFVSYVSPNIKFVPKKQAWFLKFNPNCITSLTHSRYTLAIPCPVWHSNNCKINYLNVALGLIKLLAWSLNGSVTFTSQRVSNLNSRGLQKAAFSTIILFSQSACCEWLNLLGNGITMDKKHASTFKTLQSVEGAPPRRPRRWSDLLWCNRRTISKHHSVMKPTWCTFHSIYWESRTSTCFEHYLLILRRRYTNGIWYTACV
jgi:hypothetical protein